jgi:peroxiredoxin
MLSERRLAQLGLAGAGILLFGSLAILLMGHDGGQVDGTKLQPGSQTPEIKLNDAQGHAVSLIENGKLTVVCFDTPEYPAASTEYAGRLKDLMAYAESRGAHMRVVEIQSDRETDAIAGATITADRQFVTLLDHQGKAAAQLDVLVSPTFFLIDESGVIRYRGAFDDNLDQAKVTRTYLASAVANLVDGKPIPVAWVQSFGRPLK